jgi:hypothetical protein
VVGGKLTRCSQIAPDTLRPRLPYREEAGSRWYIQPQGVRPGDILSVGKENRGWSCLSVVNTPRPLSRRRAVAPQPRSITPRRKPAIHAKCIYHPARHTPAGARSPALPCGEWIHLSHKVTSSPNASCPPQETAPPACCLLLTEAPAGRAGTRRRSALGGWQGNRP